MRFPSPLRPLLLALASTLALPLLADSAKPAPKLSKAAAAKAAKAQQFQDLVDALQGVGVSDNNARHLADRIVNGDARDRARAIVTARLIKAVAAELELLGAAPDKITQVLDEIERRGLRNPYPGSAARDLMGLAALDTVVGDGTSRKLPKGSGKNAEDIAKAVIDAQADLQLVGLSPGEPEYEQVVGDIVNKGLYGPGAAKRVRQTTDPIVNDQYRNQTGSGGSGSKSNPPATPPGVKPSSDANEPKEPKDITPRGSQAGSGTSSGSGGSTSGGTTTSSSTSTTPTDPADTPVPSEQGRKRSSAAMNFDDVPSEPAGEDEKTWQSEWERKAAEERRKQEEAERKKKEEEDKKQDDDTDDSEDDKKEDSSDGDGQDSGATDHVGSSVDPEGENAYRAQVTLQGILDRMAKLYGNSGDIDPVLEGGSLPDRTIPIRNPKHGLLGNPGSRDNLKPKPGNLGGKTPPKPGQPGTIDPERDRKNERR